MYTIYADDMCIYDDLSCDDSLRLVDPSWHREDNTSGSLTFTMPIINIGYNNVERLKTHISIRKNEVEVWEGRVISESLNFRKERSVTCEGVLSYLCDTMQPQREFINPSVRDFLSTILSYHNERVSEDKRFTLGVVTVDGPMINEAGDDEYDDDVYVYTNFQSTLECINEKLIEKNTDKYNDKKKDLKGHLRIRKENGIRYLDYLKDYPTQSIQTINFGVNLLDFTVDFDESEFCTALIPLGERYSEGDVEGLEGYLDITDVTGGSNTIINQTAVETYGYIERIEHFDDITDDVELYNKGVEFLNDKQFGKMQLNVTAVDFSNYDINVESINMLDEIRVVSDPHGLDRLFPVTEIDMKLDDPGSTQYTLGLKDIISNSATSAYIKALETTISENSKTFEGRVRSLDNKTESRIENLGDRIELEVSRATESEERLGTQIVLSADEIKSTVAGSEMIWDEKDYDVAAYGYEAPIADYYDPSEYGGKYYLNQSNGYLYYSNGSNWSYFTTLTTIKAMLQSEISQTDTQIRTYVGSVQTSLESEISQTAEQINLKVSKGDVSSQLSLESGQISITSNRLYINTSNFKVGLNGHIEARNGDFENINLINGSGITIDGQRGIEFGNYGAYGISLIFPVDHVVLPDYTTVGGEQVATLSDIPSTSSGVQSVYKSSPTQIPSSTHRMTSLDVSGSTNVSITYKYIVEPSDNRLKTNVCELRDMTKAYMELKPVSFEFKRDLQHTIQGLHYGLIAQDTEKALMDNLVYDPTNNLVREVPVEEDDTDMRMYVGDKYYMINYEELHALHIQMIQKQQKKIEELERRITVLERR